MVGGGDETCYSLSGSAASKIALDGYGRFFQGLLAGKEPEKGARTLGRSPLISEAVELVRGSIGDRPRNSAWLCWLILACGKCERCCSRHDGDWKCCCSMAGDKRGC